MLRVALIRPLVIIRSPRSSVVTKAVYPEAEAPGFETEIEAEVVAFETDAVDPEAEAARQYINKSHI